jgi:hypothetical protein
MQRRYVVALGIGLVLAGIEASGQALDAAPASLKIPAGERAAIRVEAKGVQIYECKASASDPTKLDWAFTAPEAELFDADGQTFGKHFAGPSWQANDGSKVVGEVRARADSPEADAIPLLLLGAKSKEGKGVLAEVKSIQRLNTAGGKAPAGCREVERGTVLRVPYTATYVFSVPR